MANLVWGDTETQFFYELNPSRVLDAVELLDLPVTGRCLQLNSLENRVYEVGLETESPEDWRSPDASRIAKFYRPGRWSREQILEEHAFLLELQEEEIPVIAPCVIQGKTLFHLKEEGLFYCLFPKKGGRSPDEMPDPELEQVGRLLARIHSVGERKPAPHRLTLNPKTYGTDNLEAILKNRFIPTHLESRYQKLAEALLEAIKPLFLNVTLQRIHGDCHLGNLLWGSSGAFFLDFDDMVMGPPVQDIWLIVGGRDPESVRRREILLEAYEGMREFDHSTLNLIEPLRALRYIHFAAWIGKRWQDQAFQLAFPYYGSEKYWLTQIEDLREELELITKTPQWSY